MKNKKKTLSVLLLSVLLVATVAGILIFGASAQATTETYTVDGVGEGEKTFATVREALLAASENAPDWEAGSKLTIALGVDEAVESTSNDILFDAPTVFTADGRKLPITITSAKEGDTPAALILSVTAGNASRPKEDWHCTNDYTFLNLAIKTDKAGSTTYPDIGFFAGSGNVVFDGVTFGTTEAGKTNPSLYFSADNNLSNYNSSKEGLFGSWTKENVQAEIRRYAEESGTLLRTSLTFRNTTYNHMPKSNWQCPAMMVRKTPTWTVPLKDGTSLAAAQTEARIISDEGANLSRITGFAPSKTEQNYRGKLVIEVKSGTVGSVSADPANYYVSSAAVTKHVVADIILSGGTVNTYGQSGAAFAVTGGANSNYGETSLVNIYIEDGATVKGNVCAIGGLGTIAKTQDTHTLLPDGTVNIHLNGGTVTGDVIGVSADKVTHTVASDITLTLAGTGIGGSVLGMNNSGTLSGNLTVELTGDFEGSATALNAGTLVSGGKAGVVVKSGTVNGNVYAVGGTATVQKGAEAYLKMEGGTVKKQFLISTGEDFSVEEGGKISAYIHGGSLLSARLANTTNQDRGVLFSTVNTDSYANVEAAYTKDGVLSYPVSLKAGSTVYIEIGNANAYCDGTIFAPVFGAYIGGDLHIKYLPGVDLTEKGITTVRNTYGAVIAGDYKLEINPEKGDTVNATGIDFQGEWSGKVLGDATVTANKLKVKNFFGVAGKTSHITLDTVEASTSISFSRSSYNTSFDVVGGENVTRITSVTNTYKNCTASTVYCYGHSTGAYKMDGTITNNFENCTISGSVFGASYRYHYNGVTNTATVLGTVTTNFLGGNKLTGRVYGGNGSTTHDESDGTKTNVTGDVVVNFSAPAANPDVIGHFYGGNGVIGTSLPSEDRYMDGSVASVTVNVGPYTTFEGEVFTGSRGGTFASSADFAINGGTFNGTVSGKDITVNAGLFKNILSGEAITVNGGTFNKIIHGTSITLFGGIFEDEVYAEGLVLGENALLTIRKNGAILADEVRGNVTVHKEDLWGGFDKVYVSAPATYASLITVTDTQEGIEPLVLSDVYEVRGWYLPVSASIIMNERFYVKLTVDPKIAADYAALEGEPEIRITFGEEDLGVTVQMLTGSEGFLFPTTGANQFKTPLCYYLNGDEILSTDLCQVSENGAELYQDKEDVKNLFKALANYGKSVSGEALDFTDRDLADLKNYGKNASNIDPEKISLSREDGYAIDFEEMTLLMGDTVGIRLKVSEETKAALLGAKVYLGSTLLPENKYRLNENSIDLFVNAKKYESVLHITICDANGVVCLDMTDSVANVAYQLAMQDLNGTDGSNKNELNNAKIQATAMLIVRVDDYLTYLESQVPNDQKPTEQTPEEEKILRILSVGNSHSQDAVWLLQEVFRIHHPEMEVTVAECYFSGAMTEHMQNINANSAVYSYYFNDNGTWTTTKNATIKDALLHQRWDIVIINESSRHIGLESKASDPRLTPAMIQYVEDTLPYKTRIFYDWTWSAPTDEVFYSEEWPIQPTASFRDTYTRDYGFDRVNHYNKMRDMVVKYIETNEKFDTVLYCATPVQYATEVLGLSQPEVYRDYTHLNDYGRLMVAYYNYAKIMGLDEITDVQVDTITRSLQFSRTRLDHDIVLTDTQKENIITCVNYALENPKMPE